MVSNPCRNSNAKRAFILLIALWLTASGLLSENGFASPALAAEQAKPELQEANKKAAESGTDTEPYYAETLKQWTEEGIKAAEGTISIDASAPAASSGGGNLSSGSYEGKGKSLLWRSTAESWVEYSFESPSDSLYEIHVSYRPLSGNGIGNPIEWNVLLDGKRPFREASSITLYRDWKDERPIVKNDDGDEVRPRSYEEAIWQTKPFIDSGGAYAEPLKWRLAQGKHSLRLIGSEPVAIESITLLPPQKVPSYQDVLSKYPKTPAVDEPVITLQAEDLSVKNDTSIKLFSDKDPRTVPVAKGRITYNTVGGRRWLYHNQEVTWKFDVQQAGVYKLAMRTLQNQFSQKSSFRTIKIDGKVPFQEFLAYRFPYHTGWEGTELEQQDGKPFELYLEKGTHSLSMAVTHAPVTPILHGIDEVSKLISGIERDLRSLTGGIEDRNRTWKVREELPDLLDQLDVTARKLTELSDRLKAVNGQKDNISEGFKTSAKDIRELLEKVDDIPYYADQFTSMNEKISQFIETLLQQPLQLDEIHVAPAAKKFPDMEASWISKLTGVVKNFAYSFQSRNSLSELDDRVLNVWVQRGRDYVDQLQQLADEQFTPRTGTKVKVNLLPTPQLLVMSNAAGKQPDIALGLTQDLPVDYAIRGSVVDLSQFKDFPDIYKRFSPGSWLPLYYDKGYYALPETQSFQVLFYRKDILSRLGLSLPQTWEDVTRLLPVLQQNSLNFYLNPKEYASFFYQNHANLYNPNGLKTALDAPQGYQAFKQWTEFFNTFALEREVPSFYQHFRRGTMPIGVSDYNMYVQLSAAAPELSGRWGIAPIPGVKQPDGTVERWAGGGQRTGVIFKASNKKEQAWEFMKWWISAETQEQYGNDIEAVNGIAFRWNTSSVEAFVKLPWKPEDAKVILKQWSWYKDVPNIPGGYYLEREINNAWLRAVVDGMNYRTSLESAVLDIDRELRRKQQEFGFADADGNTLRKLDIPDVNKPWEGVEGYVK